MTEQPEVRRAVVVDDHRLLAQSLALSLSHEGFDCTFVTVGDPDALLASVLAEQPDVVLLDLDLGPVAGDGGSLVEPLTSAGCRVLVVTGTTDPVRLGAAIEAGAVGVLSKTAAVNVLLSAATAVARGERPMDAGREASLLEDARRRRESRDTRLRPFARLTDREGQVLRSLARGRSVASTAAEWQVSEATVRSQVRGILTKLEVGSQLEAVALAHRSGWLSGEPD